MVSKLGSTPAPPSNPWYRWLISGNLASASEFFSNQTCENKSKCLDRPKLELTLKTLGSTFCNRKHHLTLLSSFISSLYYVNFEKPNQKFMLRLQVDFFQFTSAMERFFSRNSSTLEYYQAECLMKT